VDGQSTVTGAYAVSPLRLLTPRSRAESVWAYTSSLGGGILAGDRTSLSVRVGTGARCFLSTQATTKVYRNPASLPCAHRTQATVQKDGLLVFAPDRVQPFAGSSYDQRQEWHLADGAGLVLLDWFSSGRAARGEQWHFTRFRSRNEVFVESERVFVDSILLEGPQQTGPMDCRVGGYQCFAMLLFLGPPVHRLVIDLLEQIGRLPVRKASSLLCSASPVRDGAVLRVAGVDAEAVGRELERYLQPLDRMLGDNPWIRKW
jgi:urease accessory protein